MASPPASTPSSAAASPAALLPAPHPPLASKTIKTSTNTMPALAPAAGGGSSTPTIVTRKEWIIPPRPKPGRKPATDTPPTKRKAQNRAAQRAFRERRAARVGELEELLDETKEEQVKREEELLSHIQRLEADVKRFSGDLQSWRLRCDTLDRIVDYERTEKEAAIAELTYLRHGARTTGTDAVPLPPRRRSHHPDSALEQASNSIEQDTLPLGCGRCTTVGHCACVEQALDTTLQGCGNCSVNTHCECLEDTITSAADIPTPTDLKRLHSPSVEAYQDKRQRHSGSSSPLEIDFTSQFASKPAPAPAPTPAQEHIQRTLGESCGFCEEGTYCMCAEAAAASASEQHRENRLAPLLNEVTPPPSDTDVDGIKLPSLQPNQMHRPVASSAPNSCVNGPGTCQQCLADPKSGLFCRSLAAMRASGNPGSSSVPEGCCGGNAGGGGCCKTANNNTLPFREPPPSLSCADTYKTLSTHKGFDKASDELNTWMGRLHTSPLAQEGKTPLEVEAASVMGVLKLFDRRFGRG